jgi:hypothetical protein
LLLDIKEGAHKYVLKNISTEIFTYDPFYKNIITKEVAASIPEGKWNGWLSYRTFRAAGLLNSTSNGIARSELGPSVAAVAIETVQRTSPRFFGNGETGIKTPAILGIAKSKINNTNS